MQARKAVLLIAAGVILLGANEALAWGPLTHIALGESILQRLDALPAALAALLARHGIAFLYGSIAADLVFAKRLSRVKQFCHHWSTAFRILAGATTERDKAFAYGYLAHLAADTVAHGRYVPHQILVSDMPVNFGHLYWELRADALGSEHHRIRLKSLLSEDHAAAHRLLSVHLRDTFLPYDLNRILFHNVNWLTVDRRVRRVVGRWAQASRFPLSEGLLEGYRAECLDRVESVLAAGERSPLLREDPNGTAAFMQLKVHRRQVRRLRRKGLPVTRRLREASYGLSPVSTAPPVRTTTVLA